MNETEWTRLIEEDIFQYLHDDNGDIDPTLKLYMAISLGRVLSKISNSADRRQPADTDIYHISDWLKAAVHNNAPWLQNVDGQGRPKKLMKFSTVEQIVAEADKAMLKASQKGRDIQLDDKQERLIDRLDDGYTIVELRTAEALDRESAYMQHCIGNGSYDDKVGTSRFKYISVRDSQNKPHVTMELVSNGNGEWDILQFQGKQNKIPLSRYVKVLTPFLQKADLNFSQQIQSQVPYIIDEDRIWHDIGDLPSSLKCKDFRPLPFDNDMRTIKMPERLHLQRSLELNNKKLIGFPSSISIDEYQSKKPKIELTNVEISECPKNVRIGGSVRCVQLTFNSAPGNITVDGNCEIGFTTESKLPNSITASGYVIIANADCDIFKTKLNAGGNISFWNTKISKIEHGMEVDGRLSFYKVPIRELPDGIVAKELQLIYTNVTSLPEGIKVSEKLILDNQVLFEHIPDTINDDVTIEWKDSHKGPVLEDEYGPATVGEWRAMKMSMAF
jgi:hypothetical protein